MDIPLSIWTLVLGAVLLGAYFYLNRSQGYKSPDFPAANEKQLSPQKHTPLADEAKKPLVDEIPEGFKPLTILFGSQSGNAQHFANELGKEAKSYKFHAKVFDLEKYDFAKLLVKEKFVVLLMATYGEGDPPDSALDFDEWFMSEDRDPTELEDVEFSVFGLGNKQYEFFNKMGKKCDKRFEELGAKRVFARGEGDDDGSLEDDWNKWKTEFWPSAVKHFFGYSVDAGKVELPLFAPSFRLVLENADEEGDSKTGGPPTLRRSLSSGSHSLESKTFDASVVVNRELRNMNGDPAKLANTTSTFHIELDISDYDITYRTADNLGIFPRNDYKVAGRLAKRLGLKLDQTFSLKPLNKESTEVHAFQEPMTVLNALLWKVDISTYPRKKFLEIMAQFCSDSSAKLQIESLIKDNGAYQKIISDRLNIVDLLEQFPQVEMPFEVLLEVVGTLQPRYFTIASSNLVHPKSIHITVTLVEEKCEGKVFKGVCSSYLNELKPGKDVVHCFLRKSTFDLPKNPKLPVMMIGPGTGIAPMRAFIQEGFFSQGIGCRFSSS
eukprot:TRINITY_DN8863_c0_g1_i2.p1 TRINITY_DN8863_c0_g1~~TRINITY_DN8863_c0_g1_i2.p1  ORF type:complete len:565 (-),score=147.37 TRINITY_DN8863_c0_g1_i2:122-1774(-)